MEIRHYETSMRDAVLDIFAEEYNVNAAAFGKTFDALYEHPVQQGRCIRLVAIDNGEVAGFQSYMYWPYTSGDGRVYNSFQSGNSIISKKHRGKGVFTKLLRALDNGTLDLEFDFIVGFPVVESFGAFIKCGWLNPFDLEWSVMLNKPIQGFLNRSKFQSLNNWGTLPQNFDNSSSGKFELNYEKSFDDYRSKLRPDTHFRAITSDKSTVADCKIIRRGKYMTECIIGKITSSQQTTNVNVQKLLRSIKSTAPASIISIANVPGTEPPKGFRKIDRSFHFILKEGRLKLEEFNLSQANIGRADIDTW